MLGWFSTPAFFDRIKKALRSLPQGNGGNCNKKSRSLYHRTLRFKREIDSKVRMKNRRYLPSYNNKIKNAELFLL